MTDRQEPRTNPTRRGFVHGSVGGRVRGRLVDWEIFLAALQRDLIDPADFTRDLRR